MICTEIENGYDIWGYMRFRDHSSNAAPKVPESLYDLLGVVWGVGFSA